MTELLTDRITRHADRLKLSHLAQAAEQLCQRAEHAQMGYHEFLDLILDEEVAIRESRRFTNALTAAVSRSERGWPGPPRSPVRGR